VPGRLVQPRGKRTPSHTFRTPRIEQRKIGRGMLERVIDEGDEAHGVHWTLSAGGDDDRYGTELRMVDQDGVIDAGGMGGPKLWGPDRLNVYTGWNPVRGPRAVVARCSPIVANVVLSFRDGTSRDITACQGA
jgi:hypothetical protein